MVCPRGHSFDIARSGYINLLQPQDSRSKHPGDTKEAVAARRRLHDRGVTRPLLHGIAEMIDVRPGDIVLDAGCGDGFYLGSVALQTGIERAWRRHLDSGCECRCAAIPGMRMDRRQCRPLHSLLGCRFLGRFFVTARMNAGEFRRVIRDDGCLLVALAAPDDLMELRSRRVKRGAIAWTGPLRHSPAVSR